MRALVLLAACVGPAMMVGNVPMNGEMWQRDEREVLQRASFELNCAATQMQVIPIVTTEYASGQFLAKQIGVSGCGRRLVYLRGDYSSGWVLNSSDGQPK